MKKTHNNRINSDWQFRCAPLPAGYAERWVAGNEEPPFGFWGSRELK
jgi:hypothetical protein